MSRQPQANRPRFARFLPPLSPRPMQFLLRLSRTIDAIAEWIGRFAAGLVLLMVGVGVWNVVGRYLGRFVGQNLASNSLIEIQWYLFDLVFLLGGAYALKHDEHVRVDVLYKGWGRKRRALVNFLGALVFAIPFCLTVIYVSWDWTLNSWKIWEQSPDPGGLPRYPIKSFIIISFFLLILQSISEAIKNWAILRDWPGFGDRPPEEDRP